MKYSRFLSFQQAPVGGDLQLQVLFDAQELLVVGLIALHVEPKLREILLQLGQRGLQALHLHSILLTRFAQVPLQGGDLQDGTCSGFNGTTNIKTSDQKCRKLKTSKHFH